MDLEFSFDKRTQRYRYKDSGKFLSKEAVRNLTRKSIEHLKPDVRTITQQLIDREITVAQWEEQTRNVLRRLHTWQYTLGIGGIRNFTPSDRGVLNNILKKEWKYLRRLAKEINEGKLSEAQLLARVDLYVNNTDKSMSKAAFKAHKRAGYKWEQRIRTAMESCQECINYETAGWQPIGTLPDPGEQCTCKANCKCYKEFSLSDTRPTANGFISSWGWTSSFTP